MFFAFEADFVESLRCIPMQVRLKLDTCGIKLKLEEWNRFSQAERQRLVEMPCLTEVEILSYREKLQQLVIPYTGKNPSELPVETHPAWMDGTTIPESVQEKAKTVGVTISLEQWQNLEPIQRFALIKLARSRHENSNFLPALQEFNLLD
ncbi:MAG: nitrate reductase associated protein [Microcoleaceae cyanobacterium]|jgi:hypothetical protein